jgi:predicted ABC-type ATPase
VIAGPNGAGKSSLYLAVLRRYVAAEFVNADLLIRSELGRHAETAGEAVLLADAAYVFDNSRHGEPPRRLLTLEGGRVTSISEDRPDWVNAIYATEIKGWGKVS